MLSALGGPDEKLSLFRTNIDLYDGSYSFSELPDLVQPNKEVEKLKNKLSYSSKFERILAGMQYDEQA